MRLRPPRPTRTYTLLPFTALFRSQPGNRGNSVVRWPTGEFLHGRRERSEAGLRSGAHPGRGEQRDRPAGRPHAAACEGEARRTADRSEEHTAELQSLMRISCAVVCLKKQHQTHLLNTITE